MVPQKATLKLNLGAVKKAERAGAVRGLRLAAEHLLKVSRDLVPHEEGTLERSGVASVDEGELRAAVSYDAPYAVRQHEDLTLKHDEGRQAKYLEEPMDTERQTMLDLVAAEVRRSLR
ncbi:minor capsid protein [Microtetraspora niveoalba]|uniref:minor capsid protein n=1 Tax=Microtetraspora niveoalba TaxID=46175 RepID=UPI000A4708AD|nr:minor capsid protein [Microtetraspora niveoalba]